MTTEQRWTKDGKTAVVEIDDFRDSISVSRQVIEELLEQAGYVRIS